MANVLQILIQAKDEASQKLKDVGAAAGKAGDDAEKGGKGFGSLTGSFVAGNLIAQGVTSTLGFLKGQLTSVFDATDERQKGLAQLNAVIKSTGDVSGVTAKMATDLADSIQNTTPIDNDAAQAAENMLLTFTNIGKDQFGGATKAVTDMATAMNNGLTPSASQLSSTAIQVGKALNDPILGVTALQRVGVRLTDQQKEQVTAMVNAGNAAGAQKLIIGELNREFGGSAAAALDTYAGKQAQIKNAMTDAKVEIGLTIDKAIAPLQGALANFVSGDKFKGYLNDVVQYTKDLIQWVTDATKFYEAHKRVLNDVAQVLAAVAAAIIAINIAQKIWNATLAIFNAITSANPWSIALIAIVALIILIATHWKQVTDFFKAAWKDVQEAFRAGMDFIKDHWQVILDIMFGVFGFIIGEVITHWTTIKDTVIQVFEDIKNAVTTAMNFVWNNIIKPIIDIVVDYIKIWITVVTYVFDVIRGLAIVAWNFLYNNIIAPVIGFIEQRWNNFVANMQLIWNTIVAAATVVWNFLWNNIISPVINAITAAVNFMGGIIGGVFHWIAGVAGTVGNAIGNAFASAWNWVTGIWNGAIGWFASIWDRIVSTVSGIGGKFSNAFSGAFDGVKNIFTGAVNWIIDKINGVIHTVNNTAGKLPGVPHISDIPRLYGGTADFAGGLAVVGDVFGKGGELVNLPRGSQVYTNKESKDILSSGAANGGSNLPPIQIIYQGRGNSLKMTQLIWHK